jgi:Skp family chaperone for outer membrane proteins
MAGPFWVGLPYSWEALMQIIITLCLVLFALSPALADTYQWTDDSGAVNFTDNPDKVPAKYRKKVINRDATPEAPPEEPTKKQPQEAPKAAPQPEAKKQLPDESQQYCGQSGTGWKGRFATLRTEIKQLEGSLPGLQEELQLKHTKLQRSLEDGRKKSDAELKELAKIDKTKGKSSPLGVYGRPVQNRQEYLALFNKIKEVEQRIQDLQKQQVNLEIEAGRCGVPLHLRR